MPVGTEPQHVSQLPDFAPYTDPTALRIDLACGASKPKGWTGVDIAKTDGVDIVYDLTKFPWTFAEDNSVSELRTSHYVEHVHDLVAFMNECFRILKPNGLFMIQCPYGGNVVRAWQDPFHVRPIFPETFQYFSAAGRKQMLLEHYPIACDFAVESTKFMFDPHWAVRGDEAREWARKYYVNCVMDMEIVLRALK